MSPRYFLLLGGLMGGLNLSCPVVQDSRLPASTTLKAFDAGKTAFSKEYTKGKDLKFADILHLPGPPVTPSRFDTKDGKVVEVTISDKSIFTPDPASPQNGFRRIGLIHKDNSGKEADPTTKGVKTFHWSVMQNDKRPLNTSHEYLMVWHETDDYSGTQFSVITGTALENAGEKKDFFRVRGRSESKIEFETPVEKKGWQNFAITLDYDKKTMKVYYSKDLEPLKSVTEAFPNDNTGGGQFQVGILKKPTGKSSDIVKEGFQPSGIDEGQIYGGIFVEDSKAAADGTPCVSL